MTTIRDDIEVLPLSRRTPPTDPRLLNQAKQIPGGWLYDIDWAYPENQRTPSEAIRGSWEIDHDGRITDRYLVNARYRAIEHSKQALKKYMHAGAKHTPNQWIVDVDPRGVDVSQHSRGTHSRVVVRQP